MPLGPWATHGERLRNRGTPQRTQANEANNTSKTVEAHRPETWTQMLFLRAATQYAFTTVFAGLALTTHILPKISRLPAFVASFVATEAKPSRIATTSFFFISHSVAIA